ncbi:MAG: ASCH domain-containing protein [Acidobacteria bacterium]|nr:ASCH domain-containing protein [Acidobacteriota bacterium]
MLIKNAIIQRIQSGEISLIFRRWKRAGVKAGGTQMTQLGVLGIDSVDVVTESKITAKDAKAAGFASKDELIADLYDRDEDIYRIGVRWIGEDPRKALRENDELGKKELDEIISKLQKLDAGSQRGNWTQMYLQMIRDQPNTHAAILAEQIGLDIPRFKPWVRKLKALGLTESLRPGYRLSPRGQKVLKALRQKHDR